MAAVPAPGQQTPMPFSYREAIDQMLTLADFERKSRAGEPPSWHLKRMEALLARVGDPHLAVPAVHVAGSKGKGSTSAMIASCLRAAGYRTGLYTSPHLHRFTERIQIDGQPISGEEFAALMERLWPDVEAMAAQDTLGRVSVFELLTAMAFVHFRDTRCGAAVIEVGMGGRLDATNLVQPAISVITPISLDHVLILGDTIAKIALEKAGIIKPGVGVVTGRQEPEARRVLERVASETQAPLTDAMSAAALVSEEPPSEGPQKFILLGRLGEHHITLPLLGPHQIDNARSAVAALEALAASGFNVTTASIARGLREVKWPARAEIVTHGPPMILADGAHNEASARTLAATIDRHFATRSPVIYVIGGTFGHDYTATARTLMRHGGASGRPRNAKLIVTQSRHPKAVPAADFAAALEKDKVTPAASASDTASALEMARQLAGPNGIIVATGSLFIAAEAVELLRGIRPELYPDLKGPFTLPYTVAGV
ncbi:MAG: bifunctional folylpolyglutamate synthase/dihydrofolate synthase [Dehalococcoidia bacterium]|nr:bifunctional folylpolyglutamate synthase/dihydrofolate synthase [Dehalococcoidia bacterium]